MSAIRVTSEIGTLKKVLLHRPGRELLNLTPDTLERLLFDDIPYLKDAQDEHDKFAQALRDNDIEVVYLEDLMAEVIKDSSLRKQFLNQFIEEGGIKTQREHDMVYNFLDSIKDEKELVLKTMEGVRTHELDHSGKKSLVEMAGEIQDLILDPLPNLYFTRDPFASIGDGVSLNRMYSVTRNRETIYADYIFKYHPEYKGNVPYYYDRTADFHIEGGDILNINAKTLAIGISQRTQAQAIEDIAHNIFNVEGTEIETILAIDIPNSRAFMHLDTVFTQVDYDKFTIHPGILGPLQVFEITKGTNGDVNIVKIDTDLESILSKHVGRPVTLIKCGGEDMMASEREQWNDGSNTLTIAPGVVVVYDRNEISNELLKSHGLKLIELRGAELVRGRGGPRCMSMPLIREDI
ncbi:arginine deiminase [Erysipelothrix rhusiopathiae]|uniref:Arginine deiminase n=1 Tax=Erysipelothrix rhusiopathiae ATCC 19414 TaxID=525280 RepID=E7FV23_ERYRH|nr:arginine deiminase [Erysipelothrix rhusiopathiae]EFY09539.1 arginine deiminase [Erysipelothrix rhusiopathiae ATCC 19414]MCG4456821.1 arginine deiminase [Erysipelothrix rhusiopathiae]MDE8036959.1 arginine deiminase [Erysipelothrix rhusiopathiae]MDE8039856.1 arginine deiminase [Erysipelothrix rhusiopathiae]MDE8041272.1 arginine deiminase [Erysipelothrix rhusiopathiae]